MQLGSTRGADTVYDVSGHGTKWSHFLVANFIEHTAYWTPGCDSCSTMLSYQDQHSMQLSFSRVAMLTPGFGSDRS